MSTIPFGFCYHCKGELIVLLEDIAWYFGYKKRRCATCYQMICAPCWYFAAPACPSAPSVPECPENPIPFGIHPVKNVQLTTDCPCALCTWTCALCNAVFLAELIPARAACGICHARYCHECYPYALCKCALCDTLHCVATCKFGCRRPKDEVPEEEYE